VNYLKIPKPGKQWKFITIRFPENVTT